MRGKIARIHRLIAVAVAACFPLAALAVAGCDDGGCPEDEVTCGPPPACPLPDGPTFEVVHAGAELRYELAWGGQVQTAVSADPDSAEPGDWVDGASVSLDPGPEDLRIFARAAGEACPGAVFARAYTVRTAYAPAAEQPGSTAIAAADPSIRSWAAGWVAPVSYGEGVSETWRTPERALGPATGEPSDVVALGNGGRIVLSFDPPIKDGPGADLAVFENGFNDTFLELAFVEVSSDGAHFARFSSAYLGSEPVAEHGTHEPELISGLAGKYRRGFGTPFDLGLLATRPEVQAGVLDLDQIRYVRIVDVVGDGEQADSFGRPIYDPHPTRDSGGFDLEAVGVLNHAE